MSPYSDLSAASDQPRKVLTLLVEDDDGLRVAIETSCRRRGLDVYGAPTLAAARKLINQRAFELVLLDLRLPDGSGFDLLAELVQLDDDIPVIVTTAFPDVKTAVRALQAGASDYIVKPFDLQDLHLTIQRCLETRSLRRTVRHLQREQEIRHGASDILGESPAIAALRDQIRKVAPTDTPVLITGETGTGKELVVDNLHQLSGRCANPLVKVNCSAFSDQLLESQLFGHERGAFTGADKARPGLFEMADGGTLFLDEISEMRRDLQAKLLRLLEGHSFRRLGGQRDIQTSVRLVAATNQDLPSLIEKGGFRHDLYYRLNAFQIVSPPLRDRDHDVLLLARIFLARSAKALRKPALVLGAQAQDLLLASSWPGNVRELKNVIERAVILCESSEITPEHLPNELQAASFIRRQTSDSSASFPTLAEIELRYLNHVLRTLNGNLSKASRVLGISRNTLKSRLRPAHGNQIK